MPNSQSAVIFLQTTFLLLPLLLSQGSAFFFTTNKDTPHSIASILSKFRWEIATPNTPLNFPFSALFFHLTFGNYSFLDCALFLHLRLLSFRLFVFPEMQLHISPSLRHITVLPAKGFRELFKVKIGSKRLSYRMVFYSLLFLTFLLRFAFVLTAVDAIDGQTKCSSIGCLGKKLGPRILGRRYEPNVPQVMYEVLEEATNPNETTESGPQTLEDFVAEMKKELPDAKTFAVKLKSMVTYLEERTRTAKIQEYLYRHVASSSIPKQLHCLTLRLANEHSTNANARLQLPSPELVPSLVDNSFFHFVLASDNVLAASVVASSLVQNSLRPEKVVLHVITDRKTYAPMQAWFSLHPLNPAIIEVKALHHFDWFAKGKVPVLEAMEKDQKVRSQFRGGSSAIVAEFMAARNVTSGANSFSRPCPRHQSFLAYAGIRIPRQYHY